MTYQVRAGYDMNGSNEDTRVVIEGVSYAKALEVANDTSDAVKQNNDYKSVVEKTSNTDKNREFVCEYDNVESFIEWVKIEAE